MRFIAVCFIVLMFLASDTPPTRAVTGVGGIAQHAETDYGWVDIQGSPRFVDTVSRALVLLANRDLADFKMIVGGGIKRIVEGPTSVVDVRTCTEYLSDLNAFWPYDNQVWVAAYPVHERALCWLYEHDQQWWGAQAETFSLIHQRTALVRLGAPKYLIDYMTQMIDAGPTYQDVPHQWW